jgi:hypothetical protein
MRHAVGLRSSAHLRVLVAALSLVAGCRSTETHPQEHAEAGRAPGDGGGWIGDDVSRRRAPSDAGHLPQARRRIRQLRAA